MSAFLTWRIPLLRMNWVYAYGSINVALHVYLALTFCYIYTTCKYLEQESAIKLIKSDWYVFARVSNVVIGAISAEYINCVKFQLK